MRFDENGVPVSMMLAQSSGLSEVDRRLARSANGWRLLEPSASRTGTVEWNSPAPVGFPLRGREGAMIPLSLSDWFRFLLIANLSVVFAATLYYSVRWYRRMPRHRAAPFIFRCSVCGHVYRTAGTCRWPNAENAAT